MKSGTLKANARPSLRRLLITFAFGCLVLSGQVTPLVAQDRGNTVSQEYGDAVYRELEGLAGFLGYDYNHTAIFAGLDSGHNGKVMQALVSHFRSPNSLPSPEAALPPPSVPPTEQQKEDCAVAGRRHRFDLPATDSGLLESPRSNFHPPDS